MSAEHDGQQQDRVSQLLRDAHLHRMRRQMAAAEALCREALDLAPEEPLGLEMLGDLLADKGSLDEALELYRRAFELQPQKATLEDKIGRVVLQKAEEEHERLTALLAIDNPRRKGDQKRNALIAVLLATVLPGAGQFFLGDRTKGIVVCVLGTLPLAFGVQHLFLFVLGMAGMLPRHTEVDGFRAVLGMVGLAVWLYGLLDTAARAGKPVKGA